MRLAELSLLEDERMRRGKLRAHEEPPFSKAPDKQTARGSRARRSLLSPIENQKRLARKRVNQQQRREEAQRGARKRKCNVNGSKEKTSVEPCRKHAKAHSGAKKQKSEDVSIRFVNSGSGASVGQAAATVDDGAAALLQNDNVRENARQSLARLRH